MKAVLEGLLFLTGDEGITFDDIKNILEISDSEIKKIISDLSDDYKDLSRGIEIRKFGNIYKFVTKNEYKDYYKKLSLISSVKNLSQSALETLAIIAYNEPVTRMQVDELRGINSGQMIRNLIAKDFIKEVGRSDSIGRPVLLGVTDAFLDYFGLTSTRDLPKVNSSNENDKNDDLELYKSKYSEEKVEEL